MSSVKRKAEELANALAESQEYKRLVKARENVAGHESAKIMLRDFQKKQTEIYKARLEGKEITKKQEDELRKLYEVVNFNPYIRELLEAEYRFAEMISEVQEVISKAIQIEDEEDEDEADGKQEAEKGKIIRPGGNIWTPN